MNSNRVTKVLNWLANNYVLILILLIGAVIRFIHIDYQSVWLDEIHSLNEANPKLTLSGVYDEILGSDPHPPLYFFLLHFIFKIFGYTTFVLKLFSAVLGVLGILAMYFLGKEIYNKAVGKYAAILTAMNFFHLYYSQDGRMYSLLFLTTTLSFIYLIRFIKNPSYKTGFFHGLFASLMIYSHFSGLFVFVAQYLLLLYYLIQTEPTKRVRFFFYCLISSITTVILYLPTIPIILKGMTRTSIWIQLPEPYVYTNYFQGFFGNAELIILIVIMLITVYLIAISNEKINLSRHIDPIESPLLFSFLICFVWIITMLLLPLIRSYTSLPMIVDRYFINVLPAILLIASIGLYHFGNKFLQSIIIIAIIAVSLTDIVLVKAYYTTHTKSQFRDVSAIIMNNNPDNDTIYSSLNWYFPYFLNNDKVRSNIENGTAETVVNNMMLDSLNLKSFWLVEGHGRRFEIGPRANSFLEKHFTLDHHQVLYQAWARHYVPTNSIKFDQKMEFSEFNAIPVLEEGTEFQSRIESFENKDGFININGRATFMQTNSNYSNIDILLIGKNSIYKFPASMYNRIDLNNYFKSSQDLSYSGFKITIPKSELASDIYIVAIKIKNSQTKKNGVRISEYSINNINLDDVDDIQELDKLSFGEFKSLAKEDNFRHDFRNIQNQNDTLSLSGFATFMDRNSVKSDISVVLIGNNVIYKLKQLNTIRKDVTVYFKSPYNLDYSGIEIKVSNKGIIAGEYKLGLIVKNPESGGDKLIITAHTIIQE